MAKTPLSFTRRHFLNSFRIKYPAYANTASEVIYEIMNKSGESWAEGLLKDGEIKLGNRIGEIHIRKFKPRGKGTMFMTPVDKYESAQQKQRVYQFNDHTVGMIFRFFWIRRKCKAIVDKNMWVFKPIRSLKRNLAAILKSQQNDYPLLTKEE